jgi:hypothetical protein
LKTHGYHIVHVVAATSQVARTETTPDQWILSRHHNPSDSASVDKIAANSTAGAESSNKMSGDVESSKADSPSWSGTNLAAFRGLAPISALNNTENGKSALARNLLVTSAIQHG